MLAQMDSLRGMGIVVAILSDQTNWLEEIDRSTGLFSHFDRVFNSYRMKKSKRDASVFDYVCALLDVDPQKALFVDDNINHIARARGRGLCTIHFVSVEDYKNQLKNYFPGMTSAETLPGQ